ncbi:VWA domain-containing protein [Streptomyces sp. GD-15H]
MGILTLLRNAFSRSRRASTAEAEGATPVAETDGAEKSARPDKATAATPTPHDPADKPAAATSEAPRLPSPSPEPTPAPTPKAEASVPEPRTDEHDLVSAAFNKVTPPNPTTPAPSTTPPPETPAPEPTPEPEAPEAAVVPEAKPDVETPAEPEPEATPEPEAKPDVETPAEPEVETKANIEPAAEAKTDVEPEATPEAEIAPEAAEAEPEPQPKPEVTAETETEPTAEAAEPKAEPEPQPKPEVTAEAETEPAAEVAAEPAAEQTPQPEVSAEEGTEAKAAAQSEAETEPESVPEPVADAAPEAQPEPEPAPADGEDAPQGPPAPGNESRTGDAGGNHTEAEAEPTTPSLPQALTTAHTAAATTLAEHNLTGTRAHVYLVLDRSASMRPYYKDGSAQALAEQTLALAAHLTTDPETTTVKVVFFSTEVDGTGELTLTDHENKIDTLHASLGRMGRTSYHAAVAEVLALHDKAAPAGTPALVVFQTDGAPDAKTPATQSLTEAAKTHPAVFFSFVAFGDPESKAFDYLRKLKTPNTAHFLAGPSPWSSPTRSSTRPS